MKSTDVPLDAAVAGRLRSWIAAAAPGSVAWASASPGGGLSTLVRLLACECGVEIVVCSGGDAAGRAEISRAGASAVTVTLAPKILVIENIDGLQPSCASEVAAIVRESRAPVLLLDRSGVRERRSRLAAGVLRAGAACFEFPRGRARDILSIVSAVSSGRPPAPGSIVAAAAGDLRAALTALDGTHAARYARDSLASLKFLCSDRAARTVQEALRAHADDDSISGAYFDYYLTAADADDLGVATAIADAFSSAAAAGSRAAPPPYLLGALTCAAPSLLLGARPPPRRHATFATEWNRSNQSRTREHALRAVSGRRRALGLSDLDVLGFASLAAHGEGMAAGVGPADVRTILKLNFKKPPTLARKRTAATSFPAAT